MKIMTNSNDKLARIAMNKSLLKEFHNNENDRVVYLKDGDEFQIQIFNPYDYVIGVSFTFNSDNIDNSKLLVLKPGERIWLDRYLNENKKMKFSTYEVNGKSNEVKKAIAKNGIVNIYFYKEQEKGCTIWDGNTIYVYNYNNSLDKLNGGIYYDNSYSIGDCVKFASSVATSTNSVDYCNTNLKLSEDSCVNSFVTSLSASDCNYTCGATATYSASTIPIGTSSCVNKNISNRSLQKSKSIETGRIDKGSCSNQNFNNYYGDFQSWWFKKETIKILPESQKQISSSDLNKKYCINCGKKIKSEFKFCPSCGAKQ